MTKYIFLFSAFLYINIVSAYGQHLKFMDVELGQNTEYFKYKLSQKGFTPGKGEYQDFLFGLYLVRESRIYCRESNGTINEVFINYGSKNNYSYSEAIRLKKGIVDILSEELKKTGRVVHLRDVATIGSCIGDVFHVKDGYIMVYTDGIDNCQVVVRYFDSPDNVIYKMNIK